jgi:hypothetical protein
VSPIERCAANINSGRQKSVPVDCQIRTLDIVLRKVIVDQMIGNATGGGCQDGRFLSLKTGSSFDADGLELSNGENTLLRSESEKKMAETMATCGCSHGSRGTLFGTQVSSFCASERKPAIKDLLVVHWVYRSRHIGCI